MGSREGARSTSDELFGQALSLQGVARVADAVEKRTSVNRVQCAVQCKRLIHVAAECIVKKVILIKQPVLFAKLQQYVTSQRDWAWIRSCLPQA